VTSLWERLWTCLYDDSGGGDDDDDDDNIYIF
jgi:hypothetical protein